MSADQVVAALRAGRPVVLPTDTVYGLCVLPDLEEAVRRLYELKERAATEPVALLGPDVEALLECVPELQGESERICRALLPGPYTLVFPNPKGRYPWLTGGRTDSIGVRVPVLPDEAETALKSVGCVAATSANLHGGVDAASVEDVPEEIRAGCGAVLDGGDLPGTPSTVVDLTGREPKILREGAVPAGQALARVQAAQ